MNRSSHSGTMKIEYHASILRAAKTKERYLHLNVVGEAALLLVRGGGDGRYPGGEHCGPCRDLVCP